METIITESNIDEILSSSKPVMIDFWATWCGPCRALAPTVEQIANEYEGRAVICKCDVDDYQDIAMKYGIRNIPTLLFFKGGELTGRLVGGVAKAEITGMLDKIAD